MIIVFIDCLTHIFARTFHFNIARNVRNADMKAACIYFVGLSFPLVLESSSAEEASRAEQGSGKAKVTRDIKG